MKSERTGKRRGPKAETRVTENKQTKEREHLPEYYKVVNRL